MKGLFYTLLCALLVVSINSCKKDKTTTQNQPPAGSIQLWSNVQVIDSTQWILHSISNGAYYFSFTPNTPNINVKPGDILIGATNGGYIIKVTSASIVGGYYAIRFTGATMADVFKSGTFSFQIPLNDPNQSTTGVIRHFSNYAIYHSPAYSLTLVSSDFSIAPNFTCSFSFDSSGLTNFQMATTNTSAKDSLSIRALGRTPGWNLDSALTKFAITSTNWVQTYDHKNVPVVMQLSYSLHAITKGTNYQDTVDTRASWFSNNAFTDGLKYSGGTWQGIHNSVATNTVSFDTSSKPKNTGVIISLESQITSRFYNVSGPSIISGVTGTLTQHYQSPKAFDRGTGESNINIVSQAAGAIFGRGLGSFSQTWGSDSVIFQTPYQLSKISGDGQTGNIIITTLPNPLVVRVTDSDGNPVTNAIVTFSVPNGSGFGSFNGTGSTNVVVPADQNGLSQVTFKLGQHQGNDTISAIVNNGLGQPINGAPIKFIERGQ